MVPERMGAPQLRQMEASSGFSVSQRGQKVVAMWRLPPHIKAWAGLLALRARVMP
jgi:hypothetical protein